MSLTDARRRALATGVAAALSVPIALGMVVPAQASTVSSLARVSSFDTLHRGDTGDRVRRLQKWLEIDRTGFYGDRTVRHVRKFQDGRGIAVTGQVNQRTYEALKARWAKTVHRYQRVIKVAKQQFGDPYVFGAAGPSAFDCSGFTLYVYRRAAGVSLPHRADSQYYRATKISRAEARPGDLVFFHSGSSIYHAAIYAGHGDVFHVSRPGTVVGRAPIWTNSVYFGRVINRR
jgi:cell wall-associated NlpC family hydrolase